MRHRLLAVAAGSIILGGCAVAPEDDPVQIRMNDLDTRMQRIERVMTNQSLVDMAQRIDALQAELRTMRGEVELLQNQSEGGKAQTRTLYSDLEKRIAALETLGGVSGASNAAAGSAAPAAAQAPAAAGEQASYDAAFSALKGADYPRAISGFKGFIANYPDSNLASNAQYWLGEAYYVTRE
jgi:TolA-binding protein